MLGGPLIRCLQKVPGQQATVSITPSHVDGQVPGPERQLPAGSPPQRSSEARPGAGCWLRVSGLLEHRAADLELHGLPAPGSPAAANQGAGSQGGGAFQPKQATSQPCGRGWGSGAECPVSIRPELRAAGLWCRRGWGVGRSVSHPGLVWTRPLGAQRGDSRGAGFGLHGLAVCKVAPAQVREDLALRTAESTRARPLPRQGLSCPHLPAHSF